MPRATFHPLTPDRWNDLERLFGARGACAGCWCMWWRRTRSEFEKHKGAGNKRAFRNLVRGGPAPPGILGYRDGTVAAWCAIGPRDTFPALGRSRVLAPIDETPVWSVVCFFVAKPYRGQGLSVELLRRAVSFARRHGGKVVEGYPVDPGDRVYAPAFAWVGLVAAFRRAGFREVARRSPTRPIMRRFV